MNAPLDMIFVRSLGCGQPRTDAGERFRFLALGSFPSPSSSFRAATNAFIASGDTVGYWQQRVRYTIVATLDEPNQRGKDHE